MKIVESLTFSTFKFIVQTFPCMISSYSDTINMEIGVQFYVLFQEPSMYCTEVISV